MLSVSCWVQVLILFWASMCVMSSVLSPLIARMVSPGHRSPWAALLPGVTWRSHTHTDPSTAKKRRGKKRKSCYYWCQTVSEAEIQKEEVLGSGCQHGGQIQQRQLSSDWCNIALGSTPGLLFQKPATTTLGSERPLQVLDGGKDFKQSGTFLCATKKCMYDFMITLQSNQTEFLVNVNSRGELPQSELAFKPSTIIAVCVTLSLFFSTHLLTLPSLLFLQRTSNPDSEQVPFCNLSFQKHVGLWTFKPHSEAQGDGVGGVGGGSTRVPVGMFHLHKHTK